MRTPAYEIADRNSLEGEGKVNCSQIKYQEENVARTRDLNIIRILPIFSPQFSVSFCQLKKGTT